jgi:UDP-2,3-diacylglucosamine pyrophosphatase LpxH
MTRRPLPLAISLLLLLVAPSHAFEPFRFAILGDRTGETQPGVFQEVLREATADSPAFLLGVGDLIEGLHAATAETEWAALEKMLTPVRQYALYVAPGNHDIWSEESERLFRKYTGRATHYGFDYGPAHFTVLDNSRSDEFPADELAFLEKDLQSHAAQPVKFIVSHRPSWLINVMLRKSDFALHRLAKKYGVQVVLAGHVHQILHVDLDGVSYVSMPSSGGHLRLSKKYEDGWFFAYGLVAVSGKTVRFQIKELKPPYGKSRVTTITDWGLAGLNGGE